MLDVWACAEGYVVATEQKDEGFEGSENSAFDMDAVGVVRGKEGFHIDVTPNLEVLGLPL